MLFKMHGLSDDGLELAPATERNRRQALNLLLQDLSENDRGRQAAALAADASALAGLFEARKGGQLVGVVLARTQPGGTAMIWPPRMASTASPAHASRLLAAALDFLAGRGITLVQALLPEGAARDAQVLRAAGFRRAADLSCQVALERSFPSRPAGGELAFEAYNEAHGQDAPCHGSPENHARMVSIIELTYEGTRDYPELNGLRSVADVLAGYGSADGFDSRRWLLVRHAGEDVGCLLLTDLSQPQDAVRQWELTYMGLAPPARGKGWGLAIVRQAQWLARHNAVSRLHLAVDSTNVPALRIYEAAGFHAIARRAVFLKLLDR